MKISDYGRIGIIGAMPEEVAILLPMLADRKTEQTGMISFHTGTLKGVPVVIAMSGIGKVNAAVCASVMISEYGAGAVINTGCGGAIAPFLKQEDIVIGTSAVEYDLDYNVLGDPDGTVFYPDGTSAVVKELDRELSAMLTEAASGISQRVFGGVIGTGDRFVSNPELGRRLNADFGISACEMEGAAIAHACTLLGVPCGIVRTMSDNADGTSSVDYPTFKKIAAEKSAAVILALIDTK